MKIPCWQRRALTRGLALIPAMVGVLTLGEHSVGKLLVLSQVVLSMQLPFARKVLLPEDLRAQRNPPSSVGGSCMADYAFG